MSFYNMPCVVDMLDVDIQGSEFDPEVLMDQVELLTQRVRRLHVGTHGHHQEVISAHVFIDVFRKHGWMLTRYIHVGPSTANETGQGSLYCSDGLLTLFNPSKLPTYPCNDSLSAVSRL